MPTNSATISGFQIVADSEMNKATISGLYPISHHDNADEQSFLSDMEAVLKGGARFIQFRDKTDNAEKRRHRASALLDLCGNYQAKLIINDDVKLCHSIGADGVHLGQGDQTIELAREFLGEEMIIGISCHNSVELATKASHGSADYIAMGRFFPSRTKPDAPKAELPCISRLKSSCKLPLVAIGGVTLDNADSLLKEGADALAVINDIWSADDIEKQAFAYSRFFENPR